MRVHLKVPKHANVKRSFPVQRCSKHVHHPSCVRLSSDSYNSNRCKLCTHPKETSNTPKTKRRDEASGLHLVELRGVFDADFDRDARVLSFLPGGAFDHAVLAVRQTASHRLSDVAYERVIVHANDLDIKTAWVLGSAETEDPGLQKDKTRAKKGIRGNTGGRGLDQRDINRPDVLMYYFLAQCFEMDTFSTGFRTGAGAAKCPRCLPHQP